MKPPYGLAPNMCMYAKLRNYNLLNFNYICFFEQLLFLLDGVWNVKKSFQTYSSKFYQRKVTKRYVQVQVAVQRAWDIDGYPTYFFDEKGHLYRFTARGDVKPLRRTVKRYTQGYTLKSRFYSLAQLRPMLRRHSATDHPMSF